MSNDVFYLSLSTLKMYTAAEAVGMRTLNGKTVRKPAFKPTQLDAYWQPHAEFVMNELECLVALAGDDTRDEHAERCGISSEMLADAAQFLLHEVRQTYAWKTNNLHHAWRVKDTRVEPEVVEWVRYVAQDLADRGSDDVDADDVRVLRYIAKRLTSN